MLFGMTNAPATFQAMMNCIFRDLINKGYVTVYLDNILIHTPNDPILHERIVRQVLQVLQDNDLYLKPSKCVFHATKVEYLGVIISEGKVAMDPTKVKGVQEWKTPRNLKDVRSFIGFLNFYRRYVRGFSHIAAPLNRLIAHTAKGNKFHWGKEEDEAFRSLIKAVTSAPVLRQPNFEEQFVVDTDASKHAIGAVLQQRDEKGHLRPVAYLS